MGAAASPRWHADLRARLQAWGGNSSGVNVANIDNLGHVHPDTMWWHHDLGSVRERPFSAIWADTSDPLMAGLKAHPGRWKAAARNAATSACAGQHPRARPAAHRQPLGF